MAYPGSPGAIMNPSVPLCVPVEGGISHGKMIMIQGTFPYGSDGAGVNLQTSYSVQEPRPDTGLHFNIRFNEHCVVRNSLIRGSWGSEERQGGLPFSHGTPFEIIILVENSGYKVAVNGKHFAHFSHRIQKEMCGFLRIDGNVSISFIRFQGGAFQGPAPPGVFPSMPQPPGFPAFQGPAPPGAVPSMPQPPGFPAGGAPAGGAFGGAPAGGAFGAPSFGAPLYNPPVPLTTQIPGGLSQGKMIFITGVPHPNPSRFTVNVQQGQYPNCDIGLHFDVRFNYGGSNAVVVRNHRQGGNYGSEERHQNYFPFTPNAQFDMIILLERQGFKVAVNNQHFIEFHHRIRPLNRLDTLDVSGDVRLTQVRFQ